MATRLEVTAMGDDLGNDDLLRAHGLMGYRILAIVLEERARTAEEEARFWLQNAEDEPTPV